MRRARITPGRPRRGFSLIEVLAALVIFGVALVGYVQNIGEATRTQADLFGIQRARLLAQNILEEMRFSGQWAEGADQGVFEGDDAQFQWETLIEPYEDPMVALMRVTVIITWNDGRDQSYELRTLFADIQNAALLGMTTTTGTGTAVEQ
jgi:type II secretion system protein I